MVEWNEQYMKEWIDRWLQEDIGTGDVTTLSTVPSDHKSKGIIHAKDQGIVCGTQIAKHVFAQIDSSLTYSINKQDGQQVRAGEIIAVVEGNTHSILLGERLALNLLQRMSGIATQTQAYVKQIEGTGVRLVDTRKTTPGHRMLEKYAVKVGGGHNHRFGLYDAVMIKDNHIKASGGITQAVQNARASIPHTMKIEVEVENLEQLEEAVLAQSDIIMLDNMDVNTMRKAVSYVRNHAPHTLVEASGGVRLDTIRAIAETGVDVISVGSLTNTVSPMDISLDLNEKKGRE